MAEKVRYFLEQSVPELQDLERKKLFDRKEITMIMRRRTDFEHRIAGRGSKPTDYLIYVKFEKNLEKLRRKRYNRLKPIIDTKPSISDWSSQRRIFFIFERGVNKFPKDLNLWAAYLKFAKKNGSVKVIYSVYSKLLQLQPTNINVWLSAAKYEFDQNKNVKSARNLFKRCVRFNAGNEDVWVEFIKLELTYLSKLLLRRKLLNLISEKQQLEDLKQNEGGTFEGDNMISLIPDNELNDELNGLPELNLSTLGSIETNPVLRGDLVKAIFDVAIASLLKNVTFEDDKFTRAWSFASAVLSLIDKFETLDRPYLCNHVIEWLVQEFGSRDKVVVLQLTLPLRYLKTSDAEFVPVLQSAVRTFQAWAVKNKGGESEEVRRLFVEYLNERWVSSSEGELRELLLLVVKRIK